MIMAQHELTERQRLIIDMGTAKVFSAQVDGFQKYVADVLRGRRQIGDRDVEYAVDAALLRYGARRA